MVPPEHNAQFVAKMEDVLDVYHRPYDPMRPVVCMDEMSRQLLKEVYVPTGPKPGRVARYDLHYERAGTVNLFTFFEPLAAWRTMQVRTWRTALDWAECVRHVLDTRYAKAGKVVLVIDNLNTHTIASLYKAFARRRRAVWPRGWRPTTRRSMAVGST